MVRKKRILVTGFEPFGSATVNPSEQLARELPGRVARDAGYNIETLVLPVTSGASHIVCERLLSPVEPPFDSIVHLGLNANIGDIAIERIAINLDDYRIPDNRGCQIVDVPIVPDGPAAYFSTLPVRTMEQVLLGEGIPCHLSCSAGTYLCNHLMYTTLHAISTGREEGIGSAKAGFIHLPPMENMPLETLLRALVLILDVLAGSQDLE